MSPRIPNADLEIMCKLLGSHTIQEIAVMWNVNRSSIHRYLSRWVNITEEKYRQRKLIYIAGIEEGLTKVQIAEDMGIDLATLYKLFPAGKTHRQRRPRIIEDSDLPLIVELLEQMTLVQLAYKWEVAPTTVSTFLKSFGYTARGIRRAYYLKAIEYELKRGSKAVYIAAVLDVSESTVSKLIREIKSK